MDLSVVFWVFFHTGLLESVLCEDRTRYTVLDGYGKYHLYWTHYTVLDGNGKYHLYWKPPEDKKSDSEIIFQAEVRAKGFVGFGLSPNGGMAGSDIVTGWIKDGKVYFQDRYGIGNKLPPKDKKQDWTLLDAKENDTHTILKFSRKLDTCDGEDIVIDAYQEKLSGAPNLMQDIPKFKGEKMITLTWLDYFQKKFKTRTCKNPEVHDVITAEEGRGLQYLNDSTMRVIFAYSEEDPIAEDPFYHSSNRGSKSMMLLQTQAKKQFIHESSLLYWDVQSLNFDISNYTTIYWCRIFKSPQLSKKHHIVHVKPLIQKGHEEFVHHMVLYECVGATDEEYAEFLDFKGHACYHPNMPDAMKKCEGVSIAWAIGGEDLTFPEHVGLPLDSMPGKYYMLEVHYDNPMYRQGFKDNSGLRIYYTPHLRKYDAGCLMLGSTVTPRMFIPPGQMQYQVVGHTNPDCLAPVMPKDGIKALGVLLHAHLLGRQLKVRHFRDNHELTPLAVEKNYDFNYQEYRYYKEEVSILPNDQITVECTYNSSAVRQVTFGGITTKDEMCLAFVLYYPRIDRYASTSVSTFNPINDVLNTSLTDMEDVYTLWSYEWDRVNISEVENRLRNSEHDSHCYFGNGKKDAIKSLVSYPTSLRPFKSEESTCQKGILYLNIQDNAANTYIETFKIIQILCILWFYLV